MLHKAWNSKGEVPYCFSRSSIKFQGHTGQNITDFDPNWAFPDCRPVAAFKSLRFALFYYVSYSNNYVFFYEKNNNFFTPLNMTSCYINSNIKELRAQPWLGSKFIWYNDLNTSITQVPLVWEYGYVINVNIWTLLFIIHMNDIDIESNKSNFIFYAHDTTLINPLCCFNRGGYGIKIALTLINSKYLKYLTRFQLINHL